MEILIILIVAFLLIVIGSIPTIKYFMDKGKVRVIIAMPERELMIKKVKPVESLIHIDNKTFNIDKENFIVYKDMPTYFYNADNTVPLDPYTAQITEYSPELYNAGLESKIIRDIIESGKKTSKLDIPVITLIASALTILAVGFAIYYLGDKIGILERQVEELLEILANYGISGGGA